MRLSPLFPAFLVLISLASGVHAVRAADPKADETYYMVIFAWQQDPNAPRFAHTFASFLKAAGPVDSPDAKVEVHTISWMPATLDIVLLTRFSEAGTNLDLPASLRLARDFGARVSMWGPYRIKKDLYDRAVQQEARLNKGAVEYKAFDAKFRPRTAVNCIHAVSDIDADDGLLQTGRECGESASQLVARHLKRWIIDPDKTHAWVSERLGLGDYRITTRGLE
jgi:hypothetical protein